MGDSTCFAAFRAIFTLLPLRYHSLSLHPDAGLAPSSRRPHSGLVLCRKSGVNHSKLTHSQRFGSSPAAGAKAQNL